MMSRWWYWWKGTSSPMDLSQLAVPCLHTYSTHQAAFSTGFCSLSNGLEPVGGSMPAHILHPSGSLLNWFLLPVHW